MALKIFEILENYELAISKLYKIYSQRCPEYSKFWDHISKDEEEHASWLRSLAALVKNGILEFDSTRFRLKAIETSLSYVYELQEKAKNSNPDMVKFLSTAIDLENSIIEKKFYTVIADEDPDFRKTFSELSKGAETHYKAVKGLRDRIIKERNS